MNSKLLAAAALAAYVAVGFAGSSAVNAAPLYSSCVSVNPAYNLADNVTGTSNCEISTADQDFLNTSPITVNDGGGFFDINSWSFFGKIGLGDLANNGAASGGAGSFDLTSVLSSFTGNIMLVFKSGENTTLVGYLLSSLTGTWTTPFECPPFISNQGRCNGFPKDVSHISVYTAAGNPDPDPDPVPLPAPLLLLLSGLGGLGILGRMRRKSV